MNMMAFKNVDELFIYNFLEFNNKFRVILSGINDRNTLLKSILKRLDDKEKRYLFPTEIFNYYGTDVILQVHYHAYSDCLIFSFKDFEYRHVNSQTDIEFYGYLYLFVSNNYDVGI